MSTVHHLSLVPRDGLFCKDARGWHTSSSGRGHSLAWPWPSTVLGALRTAWGHDEEERLGRAFHVSDWLERTAPINLLKTLVLRRQRHVQWSQSNRVWPAPADAVRLEGRSTFFALDPRPPELPTIGIDDDSARESLWVHFGGLPSKPLPGPDWWDETSFVAWLQGSTQCAVNDPRDWPSTPRRVQIHVGIADATRSADPGVLFVHDVVETQEMASEWSIGVQVLLPDAGSPSFATVGSDRRLAHIENIPTAMFDLPDSLRKTFEGGSAGLRLVVTTPTAFKGGWLPDDFESSGEEYRGHLKGIDGELILRSAVVPRPTHVSGWDMTAQTNTGSRGAPKRTLRMVAPGTVYYFQRADGQPFGADVLASMWLAPVGACTESGFGRVVPGVWTPKGEQHQ